MNAPGRSRRGPRQPDVHRPDLREPDTTRRPDLREPDTRHPDLRQPEARQSDPGHLDPGHLDPGQPEGCQHDLRRTEFSWPDAREPDPLDETWQSVDLFFNDQPEPGAPAAVPGTSAAQPAGPIPLSYGPAPGPSPAADGPGARTGSVPVLGAPFHSGPKPPLYAPEPRELPSVREDPTAALTPDMVVDGAGYGPLTVRAASVRGDSHRYQGEPRQDSLAVVRLGAPGPDGLLLLAVADGVGSAARSHVGSQEACRLAAMELDAVSAELAETVRTGDQPGFAALVDTAVGRVATLLAHRAREHGDDPAAYATTLRALLVPLDPRVRARGFLAVGDGGTALLRAGEWDLSLTDPEHDGDGMIDTRTAALPHAHRARALLLAPALPGDVLVLCTDGLSTPLAGDAGMRDFLGSGWGQGAAPAPADFLWQLQYRVKSYDDDRTAVVLWEAGP
ncbi:PP2C family serine/threonine-protein phosphatase [Streptomyces sp. NBC_00328]|uniref:PP2C family serine/threonine-protein phosphatase n=1 Tax=Streptomyces sp. NBC_00328 TaxID=2903646 RepID=UPI002E2A3864|nr:protein phosphatase 2C domain-containing protein [Streptomyces sp. NBC_00328]